MNTRVQTEEVFWRIVRCPKCKHPLTRAPTRVICSRCKMRYFLTGGILHLAKSKHLSREVKDQEAHFDAYAHNGKQSYDEYEKTAFWTGVDRDTFTHWLSLTPAGSVVLDVGCAQGRSAYPFIRRGVRVVGYDVSLKCVEKAKDRCQPDARMTHVPYFFVGDASNFCFCDASFDVVVLHGVLHHLPRPAHICKEIARVLKPGGLFLGLENNKTPLRFLFDVLQNIMPQWDEKAGEEPLISRQMITRWFDGTGVSLETRTRVFVQPHTINVFPLRIAHWILEVTDRVFAHIPIVRSCGGLIEIIGRKKDTP